MEKTPLKVWAVSNGFKWWIEHRHLGRVRKSVPGTSSFPSLPMELFNQPNLAEHFSSATEIHLQPTNFHSLREIGLTPLFLKLYNSEGEAGKWVLQKVFKWGKRGESTWKIRWSENFICHVHPTTYRYIPPRKTENFFQKWYLQSQQQFFTMSLLLLKSYFFTPVITGSLDPFSFSRNAAPFLIAFLPLLFQHDRWLHYFWNMMNHFKKFMAFG